MTGMNRQIFLRIPRKGCDTSPASDAMGAQKAGGYMIDMHLKWCLTRGLRPLTVAAKRGALDRFAAAIAPTMIHEATIDDVTAWYAGVGGFAQHRASELSHVRQWFAWLRRQGIRMDDPTLRCEAPKVRRRLPRPIGDAELARALAVAPEPIRSWLLFGALAGLRSCEIAPLRRDELLTHLDPAILYVAEGKGGRDRTVPLHPTLAALELPRSGYLWPAAGGHVSARRVSRGINALFDALGIPATAHMLRHAFATKYYEASGCDLRSTQEVMGHQNPAATAIYTAWSQEKAARAVARIQIVAPEDDEADSAA